MPESANLSDRIKSYLLYPLPHHGISRVLFKLTRVKSSLAQPMIRWFIKHYKVRMDEALHPKPNHYESFNAFFTRALKPGSRPLDDDSNRLASPVDGTISEIGQIIAGQVFQAKGHSYSLANLLGSNQAAEEFGDGKFATLYLSPKDYHRIHMPIMGALESMTYIPGRLFSVAPHTVRVVPRLFARNERVVCQFETSAGKLAMVLVGAINVAAIETVWSGLVTPPTGKRIQRWNYGASNPVDLEKGAEMGRFNMGSTVILICQANVTWNEKLSAGSSVQMGQAIASFT